MSRITIDRLDGERKPTSTATYYAKMGAGKACGVGPSPSEALADLEARKAKALFEPGLAEEIAFLALGAASVFPAHCNANPDSDVGFLRLIDEVIQNAPLLDDAWHRVGGESFPGVWLYDITERFGQEWAKALLTGSEIRAPALLQLIIDDAFRSDGYPPDQASSLLPSPDDAQ